VGTIIERCRNRKDIQSEGISQISIVEFDLNLGAQDERSGHFRFLIESECHVFAETRLEDQGVVRITRETSTPKLGIR
jgi:hypothetical protein